MGEWHLLKGEAAQAGEFAADLALGPISELGAWDLEPGIFVFLAFGA